MCVLLSRLGRLCLSSQPSPARDVSDLTSEQNNAAEQMNTCTQACKHRRVRCLPVPQPGSCPRCADKGIRCVTTPVVRRKPQGRTGKRIEEAKCVPASLSQHVH